jgi:hypothetical protein
MLRSFLRFEANGKSGKSGKLEKSGLFRHGVAAYLKKFAFGSFSFWLFFLAFLFGFSFWLLFLAFLFGFSFSFNGVSFGRQRQKQ